MYIILYKGIPTLLLLLLPNYNIHYIIFIILLCANNASKNNGITKYYISILIYTYSII